MTFQSIYLAERELGFAWMSYEVIKNVDGREYRYRVERYRDAGSGKLKARWTYLGRAGQQRKARPHNRAAVTRERLIDALLVLVEDRPWSEIGPGDVATAAGLAHGTFYRYFSDRAAALRAAIARRRDDADRERPSFDDALGDRERERLRLRSYVVSVVSMPIERPGLFRAWQALLDESESDRAERARRAAGAENAMAAYLGRLSGADLIAEPRDSKELARALLLALRGVWSSAHGSGASLPDGMAELFDRAVFGSRAGDGLLSVPVAADAYLARGGEAETPVYPKSHAH